MHITRPIGCMVPMSELLYCDGCDCTLEMYSLEEDIEGDEMWVVPVNGEEKTYCENCFAMGKANLR